MDSKVWVGIDAGKELHWALGRATGDDRHGGSRAVGVVAGPDARRVREGASG
jgi:hypothetical protein